MKLFALATHSVAAISAHENLRNYWYLQAMDGIIVSTNLVLCVFQVRGHLSLGFSVICALRFVNAGRLLPSYRLEIQTPKEWKDEIAVTDPDRFDMQPDSALQSRIENSELFRHKLSVISDEP